MTIKNITINTIITMSFLIRHSYAWNMEKLSSPHQNPYLAIIPYTEFDVIKLIKAYTTQYDSPLIKLPPEILKTMLSTIDTLDDAIKTALTLRTTCTTFNKLPLKNFGEAYQHHNLKERNEKLKKILSYQMKNSTNYYLKRNRALILILAKKENSKFDFYLMREIIENNDQEGLTILLENGVSPNPKLCFLWKPPFFHANNNYDILQILKKYECDFNQKGFMEYEWNVIFDSIKSLQCGLEITPKTIKFFLDNYVNVNAIDPDTENCLLHALVAQNLLGAPSNTKLKNIDDYIKIGELLLEKAPYLVNSLNKMGRTPLDEIQRCNEANQKNKNFNHIETNKRLTTLFKSYGGITATQLKLRQYFYPFLLPYTPTDNSLHMWDTLFSILPKPH